MDPRYRLALFPLPMVLLPGAVMPLHIFELRYQAMVRDALAGTRRFGLVYHDWDLQGPFLSEEGTVGCVAEIREHQSLEDGRSLLLVEGVERFRIDDGLESDRPYFEALVTRYPDAPTLTADAMETRRRSSIGLFETVVASLPDGVEIPPRFSADSEVSFLLAQTIQVDARWQQRLLELRDEEFRLDQLDRVFRAVLD